MQLQCSPKVGEQIYRLSLLFRTLNQWIWLPWTCQSDASGGDRSYAPVTSRSFSEAHGDYIPEALVDTKFQIKSSQIFVENQKLSSRTLMCVWGFFGGVEARAVYLHVFSAKFASSADVRFQLCLALSHQCNLNLIALLPPLPVCQPTVIPWYKNWHFCTCSSHLCLPMIYNAANHHDNGQYPAIGTEICCKPCHTVCLFVMCN